MGIFNIEREKSSMTIDQRVELLNKLEKIDFKSQLCSSHIDNLVAIVCASIAEDIRNCHNEVNLEQPLFS